MLGTLDSCWVVLDSLNSVRLATGGSAIKAVEVLMEHGVPEERIIFVNLVSHPPTHLNTFRLAWLCQISAPEGLRNFCSKFPQLRVVRHHRLHKTIIDPAALDR